MASPNQQPWIRSRQFDVCFILAPAFATSFFVLFFRHWLQPYAEVGPVAWLMLVVGIDVAHVYSSLFRTYLDRNLKARPLLWQVPLVCWVIGALLYSVRPEIFWSGLAYFAVFHFVRQQYGFVMIYSRFEKHTRLSRALNQLVIYAATVYPLLYWHSHLPRRFVWFIEGDFFFAVPASVTSTFGWIEVALLSIYAAREIRAYWFHKSFNLPRNLLILGTLASWTIGIVSLNNDLAFTITNVISHGIPYVALLWHYGNRKDPTPGFKILRQNLFCARWVPIFLGLLLLLSYLEEGLWDGLVWRDHLQLFPQFAALPILTDSNLLVVLVPFLALPQATHYLFDAFLWRSTGTDNGWKSILSGAGDLK